MPEQPYPLTAKTPQELLRQVQQLMDDMYREKLGGATVGDVFRINNQSDELTLEVDGDTGLSKSGGVLAILFDPAGPVSGSAAGLDVGLVSTTKKGVIGALPNDDTKFLDGKGNWTEPKTAGITQNINVITAIGPPVGYTLLSFVDGVLVAVT